ncbi:MAG: hypothetical protein QM655_04190 [Nocardioidaceae bacterium]
MARARQRPGRRRALPSGSEPRPATGPAEPAVDRRHQRGVRLWLGLTGLGLLLTVLAWTPLEPPHFVPETGALVVTVTYAYALAVRTAGRPRAAAALAGILALLALLLSQPVLLTGVAVGTAALAAALGTMVTTPAQRVRGAVRELLVAVVVAVAGAFAVEAYRAPVAIDRAGYLALAVALAGVMALVWRLGAGLHGLGRRGAVVGVGGIVLLFVAMAYTEALTRWGAGDLRRNLDDFVAGVHDIFGAVPRPTEFLLGFPALMWGTSIRARRRQGWWVCTFGAAGLAVVATSLLNPGLPLTEAGLVLLYSVVLGVVVGYLLIRIDAYATGTRGRRARQLEEESAHRPEPGRTHPLF